MNFDRQDKALREKTVTSAMLDDICVFTKAFSLENIFFLPKCSFYVKILQGHSFGMRTLSVNKISENHYKIQKMSIFALPIYNFFHFKFSIIFKVELIIQYKNKYHQEYTPLSHLGIVQQYWRQSLISNLK